MVETIRSFGSEEVVGVDAVCVIFGKYPGVAGTLTGVFQVVDIAMCVRENADETFTVFPYCFFENNEDEEVYFALTVPKYGLIKLPNYTGSVTTHVEIMRS